MKLQCRLKLQKWKERIWNGEKNEKELGGVNSWERGCEIIYCDAVVAFLGFSNNNK